MNEGKINHINIYLEKMSILATQMLDSKDFFDINRWGIDLLLDSVNLEMRHPTEKPQSLLDTLKSYQTFFNGINEICSIFSHRLEKGIEEIKAVSKSQSVKASQIKTLTL